MPASPVLSVSQLNAYARAVLEGDSSLSGLYVRGELSGFRRYGGGQCYMTLKDGDAQVSAVLFGNAAQRLSFTPQEGLRVLARGRVSLYEPRGQFQLILDDMQPDGVGALYQQLEALKKKLAAMGIFAPERKRPIPAYPQRVAVVTSPEGAVLHDILHVLSRRWPMAEVLLYPSAVQGFGAGEEIARAVARASAEGKADVLIVGRGGGSAEDLWAFNEEAVALAVASCSMPVISAVGHETDYSVCDLAADLRAPTPSAAAELCSPDSGEEALRLQGLSLRAGESVQRLLDMRRRELGELCAELKALHPVNTLSGAKERLNGLQRTLCAAADEAILRRESEIRLLAGRLEALSPIKTLARGYAIVSRGGKPCASAAQIGVGEKIKLQMSDAELECTVLSVAPNNRE